jgi:hypothetical protein
MCGGAYLVDGYVWGRVGIIRGMVLSCRQDLCSGICYVY